MDRIVIVNDLSAPKGGATALALMSAFALRRRGLKVTFVTGDGGDNSELADHGVEIVALGKQRLLSRTRASAAVDGIYSRDAYRMMARWIGAHDTVRTVYHLHGWAQILSPSIFHALLPVSDRLVLSAHDFFLACPNGSYAFLKTGKICPHVPMSPGCIGAQCDRRNYGHKLWRLTRHAVQRIFYRPGRSPPVLAIHEAMRPFLQRAGIPAERIETLPNPVTAWTSTRIEAERNRELLFVGRLESTKGADLAAAACALAGVTLRCIGDGAMRQNLQADFPAVLLEGQLGRDEIAPFAARARALVMPSRYPEPFGLVAAEAAWSGLPVVLSSTAFLADDLVAADAGLVVEPRDLPACAAALRSLFDNDARCAQMSRNAFSRTGSIALSPDQWIDRLLGSYAVRIAAARGPNRAEGSAVPGCSPQKCMDPS